MNHRVYIWIGVCESQSEEVEFESKKVTFC